MQLLDSLVVSVTWRTTTGQDYLQHYSTAAASNVTRNEACGAAKTQRVRKRVGNCSVAVWCSPCMHPMVYLFVNHQKEAQLSCNQQELELAGECELPPPVP